MNIRTYSIKITYLSMTMETKQVKCEFVLDSKKDMFSMCLKEQIQMNSREDIGEFYNDEKKYKNLLCGLDVDNGSKYCDYHRCQATQEKCSNPVCLFEENTEPKLLKYCAKHRCHSIFFEKYMQEFCENECCQEMNVCQEHKCMLCHNAKSEKSDLCKDCLENTDIKCSRNGCENKIKYNKDVIHNYCDLHRCQKCNRCEKKDQSDYCTWCTCHYKSPTGQECHNVKSTQSQFCEEHDKECCHYASRGKTCNKQQIVGCNYCEGHKCQWDKCCQSIWNVYTGEFYHDSIYCRSHHTANELCRKFGMTLKELDEKKKLNEHDQKLKRIFKI